MHFGKIADVWKHLPLTEVLALERPTRYAETHAGSASYPLTHTPGRDYGVFHFRESAPQHDALNTSAYLQLVQDEAWYPGSAKQAMRLLSSRSTYLLCDTDPVSAASLRDAVEELDLAHRSRVVEGDGRSAVWREIRDRTHLTGWAVHIDPFDAFGPGDDGAPSAVDLAIELAGRSALVVYWYGFNDPEHDDWAWRRIATGWCGYLRYAEPDADSGIIGCGVVILNANEPTIRRCQQLGEAVEDIYRDARLPSGKRGSVHFISKPAQ